MVSSEQVVWTPSLPHGGVGPEAFVGPFWGGNPAPGMVRERLASPVSELAENSGLAGAACLSPAWPQPPCAPLGAVTMAFPCSWAQSCCSVRSWQLLEETALCPWIKGWRCFTSRSAANPLRKVVFFFKGCVSLATVQRNHDPTLHSRAGEGSLEQNQVEADDSILSVLMIQTFLFPHDVKILVIYLIL